MGAFGQSTPGLDVGMLAEEDLSSSQYCVVTLGTTANTVKKCGTTDLPLGVLVNKPELGQEAQVRMAGTTQVKANGAFSKGDELCVAASTGRVDTAASLDYTTPAAIYIVGVAMEAATASGDEVEAQLRMYTRT